jgi:hypothetical protein
MDQQENLKLCYVEDNIAYFTSLELDDQWGDDWDDAPYECNAGRPYTPCWHNEAREVLEDYCWCEACKKDWNRDGSPKWRIYTLAFYSTCHHLPWNEDKSVQSINTNRDTWLQSYSNIDSCIHAGDSVQSFIDKVMITGGTIFLPMESITGG